MLELKSKPYPLNERSNYPMVVGVNDGYNATSNSHDARIERAKMER